jgi:alpha-L-fucosidase 2
MRQSTRRGFLRFGAAGIAASSVWLRALGERGTEFKSVSGQTASPFARPERGTVSSKWTEDWEDGMVSGNGRMGVIAYGRPESPIFIFNHNRLYTARNDPARISPANTARFLPEIRRLIRAEGYGAALDFAYAKAKENGLAPNDSNDFHPGVVLHCELRGGTDAADYCRSENFRTGEIETVWRGTAGSFRTRTFVSRADEIVVLSVEGPGPGLLNCDLTMDFPDDKPVRFEAVQGADWIGARGLYSPGNGGYDSVLRIITAGGSIRTSKGSAQVRNADSITILSRIERYRPPQSGKIDTLVASLSAIGFGYETLLKRHVRIHGEIFDRATLDLNGGADRELTTDELLSLASASGALSPALLEKIYDACRYVILCSSGDLPPNLQGLWTGTWNPPWHGDYSADANLQLAVDSTCSANMPELMEGFFRLIEAGVPSWREGARKLAGCRGILYPARMQDQGTYFQQNRDWPWFNQIPIAGWLGHYFYDYFLYTGDHVFLEKRAIPYLKECALFYEDWYITDPDGGLRATPSFSYECASCDNATIEIAVAREVLTHLIEGCELLGIERDGVVRWKAMLGKFPAYMINTAATTGGLPPPYSGMDGKGTPAVADGTLKEFIEANMVEYPSHRHLSSLYPLFVSYEFDPQKTPALWEGARRWYEKKTASVRETESHYRMQASLSAARLGRGDDVWGFLTAMVANGAFHTSLVPAHYDHLKVFNVDASGGIPSVIHNCLIFSLPGRLDLLPALPTAISRGSIQGILARGQITIEKLAWDRVPGTISLELTSHIEQELMLSLPPGSMAGTMIMNRHQIDFVSQRERCSTQVKLHKGKSEMYIRFERA